MTSWPKLSRPAERCNKVFYDDTGICPVVSGGLSKVGESYPSLIDWQTGDRYPKDLGWGPLKEWWEERIAQLVIHGLEHCPHVQGYELHKKTLLMEGLLQARVGGLWVIALHLVHYGHQRLPALHLLLQPPSLSRLHTNKNPRYLLPVTTCRMDPCKNASARRKFHGETTKILLVGSRK